MWGRLLSQLFHWNVCHRPKTDVVSKMGKGVECCFCCNDMILQIVVNVLYISNGSNNNFFCFWHWNIQILIFHTDGNTADAILFCTLIQWIIGMIFSAIAFFICLPAIDVGCLRTGHPGFVCVLCIKSQFLITISDICKNIRKPSTPWYVGSDFEIKLLNQLYTSCLHSWF